MSEAEPQVAGRDGAGPRDDVSVRFYREGDDAGLVRLLTEAFGRWPAVDIAVEPIEHLRWKLQSRSDAPRYQVVAEQNSRIVGSRLFLFQRVKLGDRVRLARQGIDVSVHPEFQGHGILSRMREFGREEFERTFAIELHLGSRRTHPAMLAISRREPRAANLFANRVQLLRCPLTVGSAASAGFVAPPAGWTIREACRFDERIDAFWEEASKPFRFTVVRSSDYLNWRYCDSRGGRFVIRLAEEENSVLGYAVLRMSRGRGYIADILALPGRLDVVESLVGDALRHFQQAGAPTVECWLPSHHPYQTVFRERFARKKTKSELAYGILGEQDEALAFLNDPRAPMHLTLGDTDLI